jgi:drug/metabolite transporter (DMT)-like permease
MLVAAGACLWGTETLWRDRLNQVMPPDAMVFYEHGVFLLLSLPLLIWQWPAVLRVKPRTWAYLVASGVLGSALGAFFFTLALKTLNASVANALLHLQPIISTGFAITLLSERPSPKLWPWATVAIVAGMLLPLSTLSNWQTGVNLSALASLQQGITPAVGYIGLTALCWGFSTVAGRAITTDVSVWVASPLRFVIGLLAMAVLVWMKGVPLDLTVFNNPAITGDLLVLSIMAGFIPLFLYFKGLSMTPAAVASYWESVQVIAALAITWWLMGDALMPHQVLATILLVIAVQRIDHVQTTFNRRQAMALPTPE